MAKNKKGKKKNKKNKERDILGFYDSKISSSWEDLMGDIEEMTDSIHRADKKKKNKGKMHFNEPSVARAKVVEVFRDTNFLDLVEYALRNAGNFIRVIARLIATLILLLLSCNFIRDMIPLTLMDKIKGVYSFAMAV